MIARKAKLVGWPVWRTCRWEKGWKLTGIPKISRLRWKDQVWKISVLVDLSNLFSKLSKTGSFLEANTLRQSKQQSNNSISTRISKNSNLIFPKCQISDIHIVIFSILVFLSFFSPKYNYHKGYMESCVDHRIGQKTTLTGQKGLWFDEKCVKLHTKPANDFYTVYYHE